VPESYRTAQFFQGPPGYTGNAELATALLSRPEAGNRLCEPESPLCASPGTGARLPVIRRTGLTGRGYYFCFLFKLRLDQ
jgi:hypothetical protein